MKLRSALFLASIYVRGRRLSVLGIIAGMAVGMLALGLAVVASVGVSQSMRQHLNRMFPSQRVILRPGTMDALWLRFETASVTTETVEAVRAIPGVLRVSPEATIRFPVSGVGSLLGSEYRSDVTVTGVEKWVLETEGAPSYDFTYHRNETIPAVLSAYFLDLYNMALAESNHLPKFSPSTLVGQKFKLILGESSLQPAQGTLFNTHPQPAYVNCEMVGLTNNPDLLGLMIPLEAVEDFNRWYGLKDKRYRALHVEMSSPQGIDTLKQQVRPLGLEVDDRQATWRRVLYFIQLAGMGFVALGVLVFILALAYMISALAGLLSQRRRELALYRAVGAAPGHILGLVMGEIALASGLGIAAGLGSAAGMLRLADRWYGAWRGSRSFLPESLLSFPVWWIVALGAGCWLAALILAYARVRMSSNEMLSIPLSKS